MPVIVPEPTATPTTVVSPLGDVIWGYLPEYVKEADDGTLRALVDALGAPVAQATAVVQDASQTADEYVTPFARVGWLAAMAGIDLSTVPDSRKRAIVGDASWRFRGSLDALKKRVGETLTGAKDVEVVCPYLGDENRISVTTFASQTPDPTATTAAIVAEIPAWMRATIVTNAAGQSYANMAADYATYSTMTATSKTYGTLSQEV